MFVAALIVLLIAVLMVIAALFGGSDPTTIDLGAVNFNASAGGVFFLGAAAVLLLGLSLGMLRSATRRARARRADRKKVDELSTELDAYKKDGGRTGDRGDSSGTREE